MANTKIYTQNAHSIIWGALELVGYAEDSAPISISRNEDTVTAQEGLDNSITFNIGAKNSATLVVKMQSTSPVKFKLAEIHEAVRTGGGLKYAYPMTIITGSGHKHTSEIAVLVNVPSEETGGSESGMLEYTFIMANAKMFLPLSSDSNPDAGIGIN